MTAIAEIKKLRLLKSTVAALNVARSKWDRYQPIAEIKNLSKNQLEEAQLEVQQQQQRLKRPELECSALAALILQRRSSDRL